MTPEAAGMVRIGAYREGAFSLEPEWRRKIGCYAWVENGPSGRQIVRVGIACAASGIQARYASYNRWLAGRFKPDDEREQKVSSLFRARLVDGTEIWGVATPDKATALQLETKLRKLWSDSLDLDLMVRTSWVKREMNAWRALRQA